jgi:hypothetical protein
LTTNQVPAGLDYISMDFEDNDQEFNGDAEVAMMKAVYSRYLHPGLNIASQRMFIVPMIWGASAAHNDPGYLAHLEGKLSSKFRSYWEWMEQEPLLDGIMSYHWDGTDQYAIGAQQLPSLLNEVEGYVTKVKQHEQKAEQQQRLAMWLFVVFYFLNGLIGGLADNGTTIMLTQKFEDKVGAVTASIGTVCGLGCMVRCAFFDTWFCTR